jgi:hypothetical protein
MISTLKTSIYTICFFLLPMQGITQNLSTNIKVQAMDMANALMKNDFNSFARYMHPNVVAFAGGKEEMKNKMDSAYVAMKRFGVTFKKCLIGTPGKIVTYKTQLQAVLPQTTTMNTAFGEMAVETSILAISADKGKNWWFIDTNVYRADKLKSILPDLSPDLVIPPRKQPKILPKKN